MSGSDITRLLAEFVADAPRSTDPARVSAVKRLVMDSIGNAIAGTGVEAGGRLIEYIERRADVDESSVATIGGGRQTADAAFVNAQLAALLDFDETYHNAGHPGSPIVFAALASGERRRVSGRDLIHAVDVAYDVTGRLIDAMLPSPERWANGLFPFSCADAFGPAIASASLAGLDAEQVWSVLGLAGGVARLPMAQRQKQPPKGDIKCGQGWHAAHGVIAADLAQLGFTGVADVLDGAGAFWTAAASDRWRPELITADLGERSRITEATFKAQPACRLLHTTIEAALGAREELGVETSPDEIRTVDVYGITRLAATPIHGDQRPVDMGSAQFSVPYVVAVALLGYPAGPRWYQRSTIESPEVRDLASKVVVHPDPTGEADRLYAADVLQLRSRVVVSTASRTAECTVDFPVGDPLQPMDDEAFERRFRTMVAGIIADDTAAALLSQARELESLEDITTFARLLRASGSVTDDQSVLESAAIH